MGHNYYTGLGFNDLETLILILVTSFILIFLLLVSKSAPNSFSVKLIETLKEKYVSGIITDDEFLERKTIIEDIECLSPYSDILIERYAQCVLDSEEFFKIKNEIESNNIDKLVCEKLVRGEISYDEFKLEKCN